MNMKKLFTMLVASVCCTMAFAATATKAISVSNVTISKGSTAQLEVTVSNATSNTAFQFDLTLPKGVNVQSVTMNNGAVVGKKVGETEDTNARKLKYGLYDPNTNKYRFLSYDNANAKLTNEKVVITLAATEEAQTATLTGDGFVVVAQDASSKGDKETASAKITVVDGAKITIGSSGATTYVCDADLDFTGNADMTAYVIMGKEGKSLWLARVKTVPAGTPIYVKATSGNAGEYYAAKTTLSKMYYKNLLVGNNTDAAVNITPEGTDQYFFLSNLGFQQFTETRSIGAHKAYIRVPALPAKKAGNAWTLAIGDAAMTTLCADVDLDFSNQTNVKAYTVIGYDNGSLWIAPVKHVSAGTPLYIQGPKGSYSITSSGVQTYYTNMLVGNNTNASITIHPTDGIYTNLFLSTTGFSTFTEDRTTGAHKSYLQVLTSYRDAATTRGNNENTILNFVEAEVTRSIIVDDDADNEATGISRVAAEAAGNDAWYNLSGQRISAPTKKGLYIKNGKKVIVK